MSKRPANEQATKDNPGGGDDDGSWGATSGPPKATAAQLANRRYVLVPVLPDLHHRTIIMAW